MTKTKYNENILSIALKRQEKMQIAVGTSWWFNKSKIYRGIKAFYWISFVYMLVVNFFVMAGVAYWNSRANDPTVAAAQSSFLTAGIICFAFIILSVILKPRIKKIQKIETKILVSRITYLLVILPGIFFIISAYNALILQANINEYATVVEGESGDMFSRYMELVFYHVLPLFILSLTSFLLHLAERSNVKEISYYYDKIIDKAYSEYVEENPDYTEEMWLEYINSYKDEGEEIKPLKRSKKSKKRKNKTQE